MPFSLATVAYATVSLVFLRLLYLWAGGRARHRFPPGPRGLPIIGNIRDIPPMPTWVEYRKWTDTYGRLQQHIELDPR